MALRSIIRGLLAEGVLDDIKKKSSREEAEWDRAYKMLTRVIPQNKVTPYMRWLDRTIGISVEPLNDVVPLIIDFYKAKSKQRLTGADADIMRYRDPGMLQKKLEELPNPKKLSADVLEKAMSDVDVVYESDRFRVVMARSKEASCATGKDTAWCTARTTGQNLFTNYVITGYILYYVIAAPRSFLPSGVGASRENKWSIGVLDGEIVESQPGGVTIDRDNKPFNLDKTFGKDWPKMKLSIERHSKTIGGRHPARKVFEDAVKSPQRLKHYVKDFKPITKLMTLSSVVALAEGHPGMRDDYNWSDDNRPPPAVVAFAKTQCEQLADKIMGDIHLFAEVMSDAFVSEEIDHWLTGLSAAAMEKHSTSSNEWKRQLVARGEHTPTHVLQKLASDKNAQVRVYVTRNPNTPSSIIEALAHDPSSGVRLSIACVTSNRALLMQLSKDKHIQVRMRVAHNTRTPDDILLAIAQQEDHSRLGRTAKRKIDLAIARYKRNPHHFTPFQAYQDRL